MAKPYKLDTDEIKKWQRRIDRSRAWRKPHEARWRRNLDFLQGYFIEKEDATEEDQIVVNLVYPLVNVVIPSIYARNPDLMLKARQRHFDMSADCVKDVVQYYLEELDLKREMKLLLTDFVLCGHGWIKTGYELETEKVEYDSEEEKNKVQSTFESLLESLSKIFKRDRKDIEEQYALGIDERIRTDSPFIQRVSPFNVCVPEFSERIERMPWIVEILLIPTIDVKENPKYKNTKDLQSSTTAMQMIRARRGNKTSEYISDTEEDDDCGYCLLYEIHDARTKTKFIIADDHEEPIVEPTPEECFDYMDSRYQYVMLRGTEVSDEFYPMDMVSAWVAQIKEKNQIRTQQVKHRKNFTSRKWVSASNDPKTLAALRSPNDELVEVETDDVNKGLRLLEHPQVPTDLFAIEDRVDRDINNISNMSAYQRMDSEMGAKTATEAAIIESSSRSRIDEQLDSISTFCQRVARNVGQICLKYLTVQQVAEIVGQDAAIHWPGQQAPEHGMSDYEIKREFIYVAIFGSTKRVSPEVERHQFSEFFAAVNNDPRVDQVWLISELFRVFGIQDAISKLDPQAAELLKQHAIDSVMQQQFMNKSPILDAYGRPQESPGGMGNAAYGAPGGLAGAPTGVSGTNISAGPASPASIRSGIRRPFGMQGNAMISAGVR